MHCVINKCIADKLTGCFHECQRFYYQPRFPGSVSIGQLCGSLPSVQAAANEQHSVANIYPCQLRTPCRYIIYTHILNAPILQTASLSSQLLARPLRHLRFCQSQSVERHFRSKIFMFSTPLLCAMNDMLLFIYFTLL